MLWFSRRQHPQQPELSAFIDRELGAKRAREVSTHVETCESCMARLSELRNMREAFQALPRVEPSRSFTLSTSMAAELSPRRVQSPRYAFFAPAVALTLLVALLAVDQFTISDNQARISSSAQETSLKSAADAAGQALQAATSEAGRQFSPGVANSPPQPPIAGQGQAEPVPPTPAADTAAPSSTSQASDHVWLHRLEAIAGVGLVLSLLAAFGPSLRRRLRRL
jgi:hypothetical protein